MAKVGRPKKSVNPFAHMLDKSSVKSRNKTREILKKRRRKPNKAKETEPRKRGRPAGKTGLYKKTRDKAWDAFTSSQVTKKKRGRPAKAKTAEVAAPKKRGRPAKAKPMATGMKRGRGRPKGSKDKSPRKRRGSALNSFNSMKPTSTTRLSRKGESATSKTSRGGKMTKNTRAVVVRTPAVRIGTVKAKRGKLK